MAVPTDEQARAWYPAMLDLARYLNRGDEDAARDIVQDAFVKVLRWPPPDVTRAWMCHLVKHASVSRWRRESGHPGGIPLPLVDWTPAWAEGPERAVCDAETLAEVAALRWGGLALDEAAGWTQAEIAARWGLRPSTMRTRLYRLRHGPLARLSPW